MKDKIIQIIDRTRDDYAHAGDRDGEINPDRAAYEIAQFMCDHAAKIIVTLLTNFNAKRPHIQTLTALLHLGYDNEQIQKALQKVEDEMRGKEKV